VKKGLFSRAARTRLTAPAALPDLVEALLLRRLLDGLGLARRSGDLTSGFEKVMSSIRGGKAAWLIEASDGAADGRRKLLGAIHSSPSPPRLFGLFSSEELGLALGGENVIHTAFLAGRASGRWTSDAQRLSGFPSGYQASARFSPRVGARSRSGPGGDATVPSRFELNELKPDPPAVS